MAQDNIQDILNTTPNRFSFEFFPPKTDAVTKSLKSLIETEFSAFNPSYISITYGAGGSNAHLTEQLVLDLLKTTDLTIMPHLTCVGSSNAEIQQLVSRFSDAGIRNILALRGDMPSDPVVASKKSDFEYASDLVAYLNSSFSSFCVGVAGFPEGHPETQNRLKDIDHLKRKVDSGADFICTQLFFDNRDYFDYVERCEIYGVTIPVVAGVLPVTTYNGAIRMAELAAGARFPAPLLKMIEQYKDDPASLYKCGVDWAITQVSDLLENGVPGIHLYTLNKLDAVREIIKAVS